MPFGVKVWLLSLIAANMIAPLVFIGTLEARVVLVTKVASMLFITPCRIIRSTQP